MSNDSITQVRRRQLGEAVVVLAFLALAGLVFQQTHTSFAEQDAASGGAMFNAAMFPELVGWCLILLAAVRLIDIVRIMLAAQSAADSIDSKLASDSTADKRDSLLKALICAAFFTLYLLLLKPLGYHLMTPLFMFCCFYVLGTRTILLALALAIGTSLTMSFIFEYWMSVILPVGRFGIGF